MSEITFSEALNVAQKLKNHFQAFEKIEGMLRYAENLERAVAKNERTLESLKETISSLEKKEKEVRDRHDTLITNLNSTLQEKEKEVRRAQKQLDDELIRAQEAHRSSLATIQEEQEAAEKAGNARIVDLQKQEKQAKKAMNEANRQLELVKGKISAL